MLFMIRYHVKKMTGHPALTQPRNTSPRPPGVRIQTNGTMVHSFMEAQKNPQQKKLN